MPIVRTFRSCLPSPRGNLSSESRPGNLSGGFPLGSRQLRLEPERPGFSLVLVPNRSSRDSESPQLQGGLLTPDLDQTNMFADVAQLVQLKASFTILDDKVIHSRRQTEVRAQHHFFWRADFARAGARRTRGLTGAPTTMSTPSTPGPSRSLRMA